MSTKINVRSPYYIKKSGTGVTSFTLDLKIWTGAKASVPATATYSMTKAAIDAGGGSLYATFEVAELIRDYIEIAFDGDYVSHCVWVNDGTNTYLAVDGYGYFEDGVNPELSRTKLISNDVIWRPQNDNVRIPVYADDSYEVVMVSNGEAVRSETISIQTNTANMIQYIAVSGSLSVDNYEQRVLDDGGIYEENGTLLKLNSQIDVNLIDEIHIYSLSAGVIDEPMEVVGIKTMICDKFPDRKITFVNRLGALQDVYFFAKEVGSLSTNKESYKANVMDLINLTYEGHQKKSFNVNGNERVTLNTGYVSEDYNDVLKEMMLSEQVWMTVNENVFPVTPMTSSITYKTSLNDKLVSYAVEFEYAFDEIQNIR